VPTAADSTDIPSEFLREHEEAATARSRAERKRSRNDPLQPAAKHVKKPTKLGKSKRASKHPTGSRSYPNRVRSYKGVELMWSDQGATGYKGVSKLADNLWLAQSTKDVGKGGLGPLGRFPTAEEAALRYTEHATQLETKAIAKASRSGGERVAKKARPTPSTRPKEDKASRKQQLEAFDELSGGEGAGDEYDSAEDDVESDDDECVSTAHASRRRWPIPTGNARATRGAAMEEAAATALVEASRERVRNPGAGYRCFPIAAGSIDPGKAAIEALLALSTPADLARMGVKPNELAPAATVSTPKPAVVAPLPASLRKTPFALEPALDGAYAATSRRSVGLGRMPPSTDGDFSFPLNLLAAVRGDETTSSSTSALMSLSRSTTLDTEVMDMDMDDDDEPLPTNGNDKRGYPKFTRRSDATTVDPKLWPGAAEEGWTLSAHGGGHYVYLAPDGTRCSSKKIAAEWAEANPTTTTTTIASAHARPAMLGDMAAVAAAAAAAASAAAAVAAAATSTTPLMRLPLRTNLVIDSRLGSGASTPCSAGGPPTCFPSQCATRCASPVVMSCLHPPPSSVPLIRPVPTVGQPAAGGTAPPPQPIPFFFPVARGAATVAANTAVSTWKTPVIFPAPVAAGRSAAPSDAPPSCDGVVPSSCTAITAISEPSSPALMPRAAKPLPMLKQKARRSDEGDGPPRKAKANIEATASEPKAGGKLKRVDPALRDAPGMSICRGTSNAAFLGRDGLAAENVGASRALAEQREAKKAASAMHAAMETEIISDEGSPIFVKVSSVPIRD